MYANSLIIVASGIFGGLAGVLLRIAGLQDANGISFWSAMAIRLAAVGSYGIGFVLFALALKRVSLPAAYPIMVGTSMLLVFAFTTIREGAPTISQISGATLIMAGIGFVAR